jgi:hypothetical protein
VAFRQLERRKMRGRLLVEYQVAVDLVGHDYEIVGFAEFGEFFDFLAGKNPAQRILRIAQ